jgi:hypothetical protein
MCDFWTVLALYTSERRTASEQKDARSAIARHQPPRVRAILSDDDPSPFRMTPEQHRGRGAELRRKYPADAEMLEIAEMHEKIAPAIEKELRKQRLPFLSSPAVAAWP